MTTRTTIQCPNCGQANEANIENIIDVSRDPALKQALLSGRLNSVRCAHCGVVSTVAAPLLYHDAENELLISFVPMELGLPKDQQDRVLGDLLKSLTASIPKESFKGYMFQPKEALTLQGLVDQILQTDGVTPEMMESQRHTIGLIEKLLQAGPAQMEQVIREHDDEIDEQFFQAALALMQRAAEEGQEDMLNALALIQELAAQVTTFGQEMTALAEDQERVVAQVAGAIEALGETPTRSEFIDLALAYVEDDEALQALVGLVRPIFDYEFFQELTLRVGQVPAADRQRLEDLRNRLLELTQIIDQQSQSAIQNAVQLLQMIINSDDVDAVLQQNLEQIDDTFMAALTANIEDAEKRGDVPTGSHLKEIYAKVVNLLQANMRPELRFINNILATESDEEALEMLPEGLEQFGEVLIDIMDSIGQLLGQRGQQELVEKLSFLREAAIRQLNSTPN